VADTELDPRSDLWSVAVMVYRMATGRTPFGSGNLGELGLRILSTNPAPPSSVRSDLSRHFDEWMRKGLAKKRENRFATANELSAALVQATGARTSTPPAEAMATIPEILTDAEDKTSEPVARSERAPLAQPARSRRLWPVLAAAIALTGIGFLAVTALRKREAAASPPEVATPSRPEPEPAAPPAKVAPAPTPAVSVAETVPPPGDSAEPAPAAPAASARPRRERDRDRDRAARPEKSTPRPGTVAKRAGELWNKKDEL
jgi:eukaryotic-like serine/threonine-protein kinase